MLLLQGFLAKDLQAEALSKLDHRVKVASEQFMKILEQIDSLVRSATPHIQTISQLIQGNVISCNYLNKYPLCYLFPQQSLPENFNDCRMKKKGLVKTVQVFFLYFPISHPHQTFNLVTKGSGNYCTQSATKQ